MQKAEIFEKTYNSYLTDIAQLDLHERADVLGAKVNNSGLSFSFFDREVYISSSGIFAEQKVEIPFGIKVVLARYVLMCPPHLFREDTAKVNFRDFRDAAPLVHYFTTNTVKIIEDIFADNLDGLHSNGVAVGGKKDVVEGYDLSIKFMALPRIPVFLHFNDRDDDFPAKCSLLFQANAKYFLDMECLAITGTYLVKKLLKNS